MALYLEAYGDAVDRHFAQELPDLRALAELLARHHRSLRRPLATGRATLVEEDGDGERLAGENPRPKHY
jgi:hypothetical protein